jgi:predicted extracellular nuclease
MKPWIVLSIVLYFGAQPGRTQELGEFPHNPEARGDHGLRLCFYNVENLFDISDDPSVDDDAFLPHGSYQWTFGKYRKKLNNIAKTIVALGGWEPPALVGLAETENWQVLYDLCTKTALQKGDYGIVHDNSPDRRGIDVGLLYRREKLQPVFNRSLRVALPDDARHSRDILHAALLTRTNDTLHVFVNHWPSRYGGAHASAPHRIAAARVLREATDALLHRNADAQLVIMGDFNDTPDDPSMRRTLGAVPAGESVHPGLVNLMYGLEGGTIFHREVTGQWYFFDQIVVSTSLCNGTGWDVSHGSAFVFEAAWLLDESNAQPRRSFKGPAFTGGFSDHLPVYIDLYAAP